MKKILIFNGSPEGAKGNCGILVGELEAMVSNEVEVEVIQLNKLKYNPSLKRKIQESSAFIFVTGTYWDSWGSPLQRLFEDWTELEGSREIMGKPCAAVVLMHSVGGKAVLSRLQGVLSSMGFLIPPMSGMVYSLASDVASKTPSSHKEDFWCLEDLDIILANLKKAAAIKLKWASWSVDRKDPRRRWIPTKGIKGNKKRLP